MADIPLPPEEQLDQMALASWAQLPAGDVTVTLSKEDIQEFYLSLRDLIDSQAELQQTLIHYSNQNTGYANQSLRRSQHRLTDALSRLNDVMSAVMMRARSAK